MTMRVVVDNGPGRKRRASSGRMLKAAPPEVTLRTAVASDAPALHALVSAHLEEGRLLPRTLDELRAHATRFVVAVQSSAAGEHLFGCAELAPLSATVAEVRSLVVSRDARRLGIGFRMLEALNARARREGYTRLCAFAHDPAFFVRRGFSIVPHTWVPEKIAHDCHSCPLFRNCGQYAILLELDRKTVGSAVRATAQKTMRSGAAAAPVPAHV